MTDSPSSKPELLSCPFCGDSDVEAMQSRESANWIDCNGCNAEGPVKPTPAEAAQAWNAVARLALEPPARRDELAEFLRRKADGAGHEDAALFGLCAREIERAAQPPTADLPEKLPVPVKVGATVFQDGIETRLMLNCLRRWARVAAETKPAFKECYGCSSPSSCEQQQKCVHEKHAPNVCSECGWEVSSGSHGDDCSKRSAVETSARGGINIPQAPDGAHPMGTNCVICDKPMTDPPCEPGEIP